MRRMSISFYIYLLYLCYIYIYIFYSLFYIYFCYILLYQEKCISSTILHLYIFLPARAQQLAKAFPACTGENAHARSICVRSCCCPHRAAADVVALLARARRAHAHGVVYANVVGPRPSPSSTSRVPPSSEGCCWRPMVYSKW